MNSSSGIASLVIAVLIVASSATGTLGQDVRVNPFLPNSTEEERRLLADKERMRQSIREMMPEIRTMLLPVFEEQKTALMEELAAAAPPPPVEGDGTVAASTAAGAPIDPNAPPVGGELTIPGTTIPATAKFVACFNGKAMYRDATGTKYFNENASAVCP